MQEYENMENQASKFVHSLFLDMLHVEEAKKTQKEILDLCSNYEKQCDSLLIENNRLRERLREMEKKLEEAEQKNHSVVKIPENVVLVLDHEENLYEGEAREIVLDCLSEYRAHHSDRTRRCDVIDRLLKSNLFRNEPNLRYQTAKTILKGYSRMDSGIQKGLESLGIQFVGMEGSKSKHYKMFYYGDSRYPMTMSKTGSDVRAGLNMAAEFRQRML